MNLPFFIARRYLLSKRTLNFITIITAISIGGITIGVAALIVILSVFNGFQSLVERFLIGFDPHLRITAAQTTYLSNADSLTQQATLTLQAFQPAFPSVQASAIAGGKIICVNNRSMLAFRLYGVDTSSIGAVSGIATSVVAGRFDIANDTENTFLHVVMGAGLADKLRLAIGDTITLLAPSAIEAAITQAAPPLTARAILTGVFQSSNKDYDNWQGYTSLVAARHLLRAPDDAALSIDVRCGDARLSESARECLLRAFPPDRYRIETWYDLHRDLYNVMRFERLSAFLVLSIIIFVAVFNIFASLSMTVAEKRAEIGILKAMGATPRLIVRIFFSQSILVGTVGTFAGVVLGLALCWGQLHFGWFSLDTARYLVPAIPIIIHWADVLVVSAVALVLSLLAGFVPARRAGDVRSAVALLRKERL